MLKSLIKVRLASLAAAMMKTGKSDKKGVTKGKIVLFGLLYLYVMVVFAFLFGTMFISIAQPFAAQGLGWVYFTLYAIISFALMAFGSAAVAKSQIFDAKDNDLLLSMPIPPSYILISRMSVLCILNFFYQLVVLIPAAVVWGITVGFSVLSFVSFILISLGVLLFATALSLLLGWLIALASRKAGNKTLVAVLFSFAFLAVYMYFVSSSQKYIMILAENGAAVAGGLKAVIPLYWIGAAISDGNVLYLLLSLLLLVLPFIAAMYILAKTFLKIISQSRSVARVKEKKVSYEAVSAGKALLKRDFARLFSSAPYLLNSSVGVFFSVIAAAVLILQRDSAALLAGQLGVGNDYIASLMLLGTAFMTGMVMFTSSAISIEGKSLWILKSLPIATTEIFRSKLALHIIAVTPAVLIMWLAINICFYAGPLFAVYSLLLTMAYVFLSAGIGLAENLKRPVLDWSDETVAVKSGMSVLFTMLLNMALAFAPLIAVVILGHISLWAVLIVWLVLMILMNVLTYGWIKTKGVRAFAEL